MYWLLSMVGNWYNQAGFGVYLPMRSLFKISVHIRMLIFLLYPYIHMSSVALPFPGFRFASVEFPLQVKLPSPSDAPSQFRNAKKLRQNLWSQKKYRFQQNYDDSRYVKSASFAEKFHENLMSLSLRVCADTFPTCGVLFDFVVPRNYWQMSRIVSPMNPTESVPANLFTDLLSHHLKYPQPD